MDDFDRAILLAFDQSAQTDPMLKEQARSYTERLRAMPDVWQLCMQRFGTSSYAEVQFWCLQTLQQSLEASFGTISSQHQDLIKQTLLSWTKAANQDSRNQLQPFLRNKLAQVIVLIVREKYPAGWPSVFQELIRMAQDDQGAVDMLCRVLTSLDEDVITLDVPRDQKAMRAATDLKDAMRETCLPELMHACYQLALQLHSTCAGLAAGLLQAVSRYVNWIDISLVANEQFISLLAGLLRSGNTDLQAAAAAMLHEIASKRMDPSAKLAMLQQLGVADVCAAWAASLKPADPDSDQELALKCAQLLSALSTEVLEAWKKLENSLVSMAAVGLAVPQDAAGETEVACTAAQGMLHMLFPPVLGLLASADSDVALAAVPLLGSYVNKLKLGLKRSSNVLPEAQRQQLVEVFRSITASARYPSDLEADEQLSEETSQAVMERRLDLFVLMRNASRIAADDAYSFASMQLRLILGRSGVSFQEVEVVVATVYELGEGAPEAALKVGSGGLAALVLALFRAALPHAGQHLVASALLECYVRYTRVLAQEQSLLPHVLGYFLGSCGMGHSNDALATRACYLFCRLMKALRGEMQAHLAAILQGLQPHLAHIITHPRAAAPQGTKQSAGSTLASGVDDRLYAFEAAGLLLGQEELPALQQTAAIEGVLQPLLAQIAQQLPLTAPSAGSPAAQAEASLCVQQALEAITRLSKGFSLSLCTRARPKIGGLLQQPLQTALQIPLVAPEDRGLRTRVISLIHRLVECLGPAVLPRLPGGMRALLPQDASATALADVLALLNQLAIRFKAALEPLLAEALPAAMARFRALLPPGWEWTAGKGATSEEAREFAEVQKALYSLLAALISCSLTRALLAMDESILQLALSAVVEGGAGHPEAGTRRTCMQILRGVAAGLGAPGPNASTSRWLLESCAGRVALQGLVSTGMDPKDASTHALLGDAAALLLQISRTCGPELLHFVQASAVPALGIQQQSQAIVAAISAGDQKQLKTALLAIVPAQQMPTRLSNGHMDLF